MQDAGGAVAQAGVAPCPVAWASCPAWEVRLAGEADHLNPSSQAGTLDMEALHEVQDALVGPPLGQAIHQHQRSDIRSARGS